MKWRLRRVTVVVTVAAGTAAVTLLVGLVTNAASEQEQWPGLLAYVQRYPWQSLAGLAAVAIGLASALTVLSGHSEAAASRTAEPPPARQPSSRTLTSVLRTLPRDLPVFADREQEISSLLGSVGRVAAGETTLPVHTVDGMAGVGKTAFAIHVGHLLAQHFPDGQLFLDLNGHSPDRPPVAASEALASLLLADGVPPQRIPVGDDPWMANEARAAMWRSRSANRRMLVILDNAASFAQVKNLMPGAGGSLVLVTSRRRLVAPEAVSLQMEPLDGGEAAELFVRLSGRANVAPAPVDELVELCGQLPLAISLLAARLRHHPSWSADDLKNRLLTARDRLTEMRLGERAVAAAFDLSYQDLPADQRLFFLRLSVFPGQEIDEFAAAALGDVPREKARRYLEALYEDHLLDENEHGRYRFHDLVRDYARSMSRAGLPADDQALDRLAEYYVRAVAVANRFIGRGRQHDGAAVSHTDRLPVLGSPTTALAWMGTEYANVLSCVEECLSRGKQELVSDLAAVMAPFLRHAGPWDRAVRLHRAAAAAAQETGDRAAEAEGLGNLGMVSRLMGDYPAAVRALTESLDAHRAAGDRGGQGHVLNQLGIVWYLMADYAQAESAQAEALAICQRSGDLLGQANALADLGMVRRMTGDLSGSARAQAEALSLYRRLEDRFGEANALRALGTVSCLTGDYPAAVREATDALAIYQEIDDRAHEAYALNELGVVRMQLGDTSGAAEAHQGALRRFQEVGDRFGEADAIRHLGVLDRLTGDIDAAMQSLAQAAAIYADLGSRGGRAAATSELGVVKRLCGDLPAAQALFEEALATFRDLEDRCGEVVVLNQLGVLHMAAREPATARGRFELAVPLSKAIPLPLEEAHALRGLAECDASSDLRGDAVDKLHLALSIYERLGAQERREAAAQLQALVADSGPADAC